MKVIHTYVDNQSIIWKELLYVQYLSAILAKKHYVILFMVIIKYVNKLKN